MHALLDELGAAVASRRPVVLATVVQTRRSAPRRPGAKLLVYGDGDLSGTIGGGEMETRVIAESHDLLQSGGSRLVSYELLDPARGDPGVCGGEVQIYLEAYMPSHAVYVIGCGHVGQTVVDLAHWLGYTTIAVDDRPERTTAEALPNADVRITGSAAEAFAQEPVPDDASIVLVTRNADLDMEIIPHALRTTARYIGVMGSNTRWLTTRKALVESGTTESDLDRIDSPIGIELHAETLEEIAVSIMSEIIRVNRDPSDG